MQDVKVPAVVTRSSAGKPTAFDGSSSRPPRETPLYEAYTFRFLDRSATNTS